MNNKQITNNKTLDKRNPPPLTVSCAPLGDEGPTVYIQTDERKKKAKKQKQSGQRADNNPRGLSNIPPSYNRKTHSDWCSRADVATENRWTVNMPSFNRDYSGLEDACGGYLPII
jgi:hypothetical protein